MLERGRADFANAERPSGLMVAKEVFGSTDKVSAENLVISELKLRLIVSQKHPNADQIIATANKALTKLRESGKFQKIVDKHLK